MSASGLAGCATTLVLLTSAMIPAAMHGQECVGAELEGRVKESSSGVPLSGATVLARWAGVETEAITDAAGRFVICAGREQRVTLRAQLGALTSPSVDISTPTAAGEVELLLDLMLLGTDRQTGSSRVIGDVVDADTGGPVAGVLVYLTESSAEAMTDEQGLFTLDRVLPGTHRIELHHIAYGRQQATIHVPPQTTVQVRVPLRAQPIAVEPLQVQVTGLRVRRLEVARFYERREWGEKLGRGHYFTAEDIERRNPLRITHMVGDLPGVRVDCGGHGRRCEIRMTRAATCPRANVYVDGIRVIDGDRRGQPWSLDELVLPIEIAGIEVYSGPASLPAEFSGPTGQCGAVVIWTK